MTALQQIVLQETDRCVLCGMCAPHCPTYQLSLDENESPRGRIVSLQAYASGKISDASRLLQHLQNCVACRACEAICPSEVSYQKILVNGMALLRLDRHMPSSENPLPATTEVESEIRVARWLQRSFLGGALNTFSRHSDHLKSRQWRMLPALTPPRELETDYRSPATTKGRVALFTGCISKTLENSTLHHAVACLLHAGFDVDVPDSQVCCGALDMHQGNSTEVQQLIGTNLQALSNTHYDAIISIASGCGGMLKGYADIVDTTPRDWSGRIHDISAFLARNMDALATQLQPLAKRVLIHNPCTLHYPMRQANACESLLAQIPDIKLHTLDLQPRCCGAGGRHMLQHPEHADRLLQPTLDAIENMQADILVSSNLGCAMHIRQGLLTRGMNTEVRHPVDLLAEQLGLANIETQG